MTFALRVVVLLFFLISAPTAVHLFVLSVLQCVKTHSNKNNSLSLKVRARVCVGD